MPAGAIRVGRNAIAAAAALLAAAATPASRAESPAPAGQQQARSDGVTVYIEQPGAHCASGGLRVVESVQGAESKSPGDTRYLCEGASAGSLAVAERKHWAKQR